MITCCPKCGVAEFETETGECAYCAAAGAPVADTEPANPAKAKAEKKPREKKPRKAKKKSEQSNVETEGDFSRQ